jgi:hypothetical protein
MLPADFVHSVRNQLEIVLGKAELLELEAADESTKASCAQIKQAAVKILSLLNTYSKKQVEEGATDIAEVKRKRGA